MTQGVFVVGTDTGVGKTLVACALLHRLRLDGVRAVGMKPVAAGASAVAGELHSDDARALRAASAVDAPPHLTSPYVLPDPISPHLAARRAGVVIDIAVIAERLRQLAQFADAVVVEGAGGFCVPLGEHHTGADLAVALGLPLVLVVGLRLGCLNHALLTAEAIAARGLVLAGWVANEIDPAMAARDDNIQTLHARLHAPLLGSLPWCEGPDPQRMAERLQWPPMPPASSVAAARS